MRCFALLLAAVILSGQFAANASVDEAFEQLRDLGENYEISGVVCEQLARIQYAEIYPAPEFEVVSGVAYGDDDGTLGELDVIVFEKTSGTAVLTAEVKCWEDSRAALRTAKEQQARFKRAVASGEALYFKSAKADQRVFEGKAFRAVREFESVGPRGSKLEGFNRELSFSLGELGELRSKLLQCQAARKCPKN